jgi:ABC-type polysaccharide/polyol phosphate transport system ATPase subunit
MIDIGQSPSLDAGAVMTPENTQPAVHFQNVSKLFVYDTAEPRSVLEAFSTVVRRSRRSERRELWAVQDVSMAVQPGETVGIVGRNGSGKSTLLKLASGIIRPTSGAVTVRGRLSALLELGAGFHPDLTGHENIFLNGSILGMSRDEIGAYYDDIVNFSELGEYIHMPVKHYSSGMYMRLGFSVAVHVRPDVLLVDEILAVGDQAFQDKCIERILELRRQGTTILFVSHSVDALRDLCSHLLWIDRGRVQASGPLPDVLAAYQEYLYGRGDGPPEGMEGRTFRRWGTGEIEIRGVRFVDAGGRQTWQFRTGEAMTVEIDYLAHQPMEKPEFGLAIYRQDGVQVSGPNNHQSGRPFDVDTGPGTVCYHIPSLPLLPATYLVTAAVHDGGRPHAYDSHHQGYSFRVVPSGAEKVHGLVNLGTNWEWRPTSGESLEPEDREQR